MLANIVHFYSDGKFYEFTTIFGVIVGVFLCLANLAKALPNNKIMQLVMLAYDTIWAFFSLLSSSLIIKYIKYSPACGASTFFGYVAMITYILDGFFTFIDLRNGGSSAASQPDSGTWSTNVPPPKY